MYLHLFALKQRKLDTDLSSILYFSLKYLRSIDDVEGHIPSPMEPPLHQILKTPVKHRQAAAHSILAFLLLLSFQYTSLNLNSNTGVIGRHFLTFLDRMTTLPALLAIDTVATDNPILLHNRMIPTHLWLGSDLG